MKDCIYSQSLCRLYVKRVVSNKKRSTRDYTDERIVVPLMKKREQELVDEENELKRWMNKEVDDSYILRYWEQYTNAIS